MKYVIQFFLILCAARTSGQTDRDHELQVDGRVRHYILHIPSSIDAKKEYPLVIVLHGGRGHAAQIMRSSGFNAVADREKFYVMYPDGIDKSWRDGRIGPRIPAYQEDVDDIRFIRAAIADMKTHHAILPDKIFATGISNGAMMSLYIGYKLSDQVRAIAAVCGNIPDNLADQYKQERPISILLINGTEDKLVPYNGGPVLRRHAGRGTVLSTSKTIETLVRVNGISNAPVSSPIADEDPRDGCTAKRVVYAGENVSVELIEVLNGGHTWPGGTPHLPKMIVGKVCRDFKAEEVIWNFFKSQAPR